MQGSFICALVALLSCWVLVAYAGVPSVPNYAYNQYEIFWVNSPDANVAFLLTLEAKAQQPYHNLYRSTDKGLHWVDAKIPVGGCRVQRIYQSPITPDQLLFIGPPESSCGFVTNDAGLTYTSITVPSLQHISFDVNGWALGKSSAGKYYTSNDMFNKWTEITGATHAEWVLPADNLPVYSLYLIKDGVFGYSTDYGATMVNILEPATELYKTANFIYVLTENRSLTVGLNKDTLYSAYFPFGEVVPNVFSVSDDASGATWFYTDVSFYWGNVYTTGAAGGLYVESKKHVLKRDDAFLDIHSVRGLPGVHLLNEVVNYNDYRNPLLRTWITFDNGGDWQTLTPPKPYCDGCSLNLYFNYKSVGHSFYTSSHTIGLIIANGYVSSTLSYDNPFGLSTYLSRDAGLTWEQLYNGGNYVFQVGANGGVLLFADRNVLTNFLYYSLDQGKTVSTVNLQQSAYITTIETSPTGNSSVFVVSGVTTEFAGIVFGVDLSTVQTRTCGTSDYESWSPSDGGDSECWLGQKVTYSRRIRNAACVDYRGELITGTTICQCDYEDYECDFGYSPANNKTACVLDGDLPPYPPKNCIGSYHKSQGFRLVPGDKCEGGLNRGPLTVQCPKEKKSSSNAWVAIVVILAVAIVLGLAAFIIYRDPSLREKVMSFLRINRGGSRYGRVGGRSNSLADENDFGIHDDLLEDGGEEEDAKVLHDNDISKASGRRYEIN